MHGDGDDFDSPSRRSTPGAIRNGRSGPGFETQRPLLGTPYVLEGAVGKGGMSQVYRGLHVELDRPVAIKLLNPNLVDHPEALSRLRREARILARLGNPNVVHVYDLGVSEDGLPYIAMQLLQGMDLRTFLTERTRLDFPQAVQIATQVANALQAVHQEGLVHRDLKPENVILENRPTGLHVTVLDFGIAHIREGTETKLTVEGQLVGTPGYIAPELLVPGSTPSAFADQYSLGVLIYEMLTGRTPHEGDSVLQILNAQNANPPDPIGPHLAPGQVSKRAQWAIMKALSRHPENRFADIDEFMGVLRNAKETATRLGGLPKTPKKRGRLIVGAALVGALVGGIVSLTKRTPSKSEAPTASAAAEPPLGTLKIGWGSRRGRFSVYPFAVSSSMVAMELIAEPLIETTQSGQFVPRAASRWEVAPDGRSVVVTIRKGAFFSAHPCLPGGSSREATSADLEYSIKLRNGAENLFKPDFGPTEILDRYRARVTFVRPSPFPEAFLATVFLVPHELAGSCDDPDNLAKPVGTGPFRLAAASPASYLRLERNPDYWQKGVPRLDYIDIHTVSDEPAAVADVLRGRIDIANLFRDAANFMEDLTASQPRFKTDYQDRGLTAYSRIEPNSLQRFGLMLIGDGPHTLAKVRRAVAIGLDRRAILAQLDTQFTPQNRFLDGRFVGFDAALTGFPFDPAEAKRLVSEVKAENPDLEPLKFGAYNAKSRVRTLLITAQLEALGLPCRVVDIPRGGLANLESSGLVHVLVAHEVLPTFGEEPLPVLLHDQAVGAKDAKLTELRASASTQLDQKRRAKLYGQIEERLIELVPYIPIGMQPSEVPGEHVVVGPRVANIVDPITKRLDPLIISIFSRVGLTDAARRSR